MRTGEVGERTSAVPNGGIKMKRDVSTICLLALLAAYLMSQSTDFPKLTGPYLGQKPPGKTLAHFADDIPDFQRLHGMIRFSPDGKEAYWKPGGNPIEPIRVSRIEAGHWTEPVTASFSAENQGDDSPFLSHDGKKLYFISRRALLKEEQAPKKTRIWFTERSSEGWSDPKPLPDIVNNTEGIHWQFSIDKQGNLYFGAREEDIGEIYCTNYLDGQYSLPDKLGPEINKTGIYNYAPYIYPDGNTLLFNRGQNPGKLCVSFRKKNGAWTEALILNDYLRLEFAILPAVTPDGKYLFFNGGGGCRWIDTGFIEQLREGVLHED